MYVCIYIYILQYLYIEYLYSSNSHINKKKVIARDVKQPPQMPPPSFFGGTINLQLVTGIRLFLINLTKFILIALPSFPSSPSSPLSPLLFVVHHHHHHRNLRRYSHFDALLFLYRLCSCFYCDFSCFCSLHWSTFVHPPAQALSHIQPLK